MTRLGIVVALPGELKTLTRQFVTFGTVVGLSDDVLLALSGVGAEHARAAGKMLLTQGATALLSWGSAAALGGRIGPGSLILPKEVIAACGSTFPVDPEWHKRLCRRLSTGFAMYTQALVESPTVLASPSAKRALFKWSGGIAVDMESAALGALAQEADVPFMVIRAVVDSADMAVPLRLVNIITSAGRRRPTQLLAAVMFHPMDWPAVARLAWGFRAATATLTGVARCAGDKLLAPA